MVAWVSMEVDGRTMIDKVLRRAQYLDRTDRILIEQVVGQGVSPTVVATLSGAHPRTVQRRLRRLVQRLCDPRVGRMLRHCDRWAAVDRQVAISLLVRGCTMRQTANLLGLPFHQVRRRADAVRLFVEQAE